MGRSIHPALLAVSIIASGLCVMYIHSEYKLRSETVVQTALEPCIHAPIERIEPDCPPPVATVVAEDMVREKIVYIEKPGRRDLHYPIMLYEGFGKHPESASIVAENEGAANILFYLWCGAGRFFEFKHMLSVLSAIKIQQPIKVMLFHWKDAEPKQDLYNNWLEELQKTFYNFEINEVTSAIPMPADCSDPQQMSSVLSAFLAGHGGIYMNENVILRHPVNEFRMKSFVLKQTNGYPGVVIARGVSKEELDAPRASTYCVAHNKFQTGSADYCVSMDFAKIYPRDIMTSDSAFDTAARQLFYGSEVKKEPVFDLSNPIPNIGHFYLIGDNFITFFIYLSIASMVNVLKVDAVYVHGDVEPHGDYWTRLLDTGKIKFVYCPPIEKVFGNAIDPGDKFHGKDILSVYFLYIYGGVFIDWDAVFTRPLDDAVRGYDTVLGFDWFIPDEAPAFPEVINPGVLAAKRHSVFISMWLEEYKNFGKGGFYYTGLLVPYKIYEHYPETVRLDTKFQVICWMDTCHPPWMDGYTNPKFHSEFDWESVYSVHFTYPDPFEFANEIALKNATTMYGRMGQRVMGWS